jgi:hypothetical protein
MSELESKKMYMNAKTRKEQPDDYFSQNDNEQKPN